MLFSACGVCKNIIKTGAKKYILAITEVIEKNVIPGQLQQNFQERLNELENCRNKIKVFEFCEDCKKVLEHVLKMRREEIEKTLKEIEKSMGGEPNEKI